MSDGVEYDHKVVPPLNLDTAKLETHWETPHGQEEKKSIVSNSYLNKIPNSVQLTAVFEASLSLKKKICSLLVGSHYNAIMHLATLSVESDWCAGC